MDSRTSRATYRSSHRGRSPSSLERAIFSVEPPGRTERDVDESEAVEPFEQSARYQERVDHEGDGYGARFFT